MSLSENRRLFAKILDGELPSTVFNMMLETVHDLDKYVLAEAFLEEYDRLDDKVISVIWHWKSVKSMRGTSDQQLDETLLRKMREAGYKV
ncbi:MULTISPECIES: hypothetical protein [unclassified Pseudomonas]|uniref:hypothetical protein n=1 Tax=unclassified Pseudomonas TaxID=196821 RepID=UPI000A1FD2BB|nr:MULTISPECIES: hypothetical protein [unclassified Pseudomonas]MCX4216259.1 hypothetical protein [Pseudomonas sp. MCal1]